MSADLTRCQQISISTSAEEKTLEYDNPWKEALALYFEDFMGFFFPHIHAEIDWAKGYEFLDKELEKIVRDAEIGRRYADKLVKIFLLSGGETWLLIHIEIQNDRDSEFEKRMIVYNSKILKSSFRMNLPK